MDVWWGTGSVLSEAVSKCQSWLEGIAEAAAAPSDDSGSVCAGGAAALPWDVPSETGDIRKVIKDRVLALSQDRDLFLRETPESHATALTPSLSASAGAVLKEDPALRQLRFQLVPRHVNEEQFWRRYFAAVAAVKRKLTSGSSSGTTQAAGPTLTDSSEGTAASHSRTAASSSLPGPHVRWQVPSASDSHMADADPASAGVVPHQQLAGHLVKTLSQVSSMAEALLSPRSLQSERTTAAAAAADAMSIGSAAMSAATAKSRGHSSSSAAASSTALASPLSAHPQLLRGGSSGGAAVSAAGSECGQDQAALGSSGSRRVHAPHRVPQHDVAKEGMLQPLPRFKWHTNPAPSPSAGAEAAAAAASVPDDAATASAPTGNPQPPDSSTAAPECSTSSQPQLQPSAADNKSALPDDSNCDAEDMGSDRDGSEWSHCSDQFGVLSAELEAHDSEWMVL